MSPETLNEMRTLSLAASVLIPLVEEKRLSAYERLLGSFRHHHNADLALVAEVNAYQSILDEINIKLNAFEQLTKEPKNV